jgi:hypothetical protein
MVNTSGAEALFRCINIFVKEPCPASSDRFTGVQAKRHREIVQVNAMKGNRWPVTVLSTSIKMLHDHTLLRRDGTKRVAEWGYVSGPRISPVYRLFTAGKGRPVGKACAGQNIVAPAFTQTFTAGKGRLWRSEGVAGQDLDELEGTGREKHVQRLVGIKGDWHALLFTTCVKEEGMAQMGVDGIGSVGFGSTRADPVISTVVKSV